MNYAYLSAMDSFTVPSVSDPTTRNVLTKENIFLVIKNFLNLHSLMQFEKAIDLIEVERCATSAMNTPTLRLWQTVLNVLSQVFNLKKTII